MFDDASESREGILIYPVRIFFRKRQNLAKKDERELKNHRGKTEEREAENLINCFKIDVEMCNHLI